MNRSSALIAVAAGLAALTACGGGPHKAATVSKSEMTTAAINRVCSDVNAWMDAVSDPLAITVPSRVIYDGQTYGKTQLGKAVHILAADTAGTGSLSQPEINAVAAICQPYGYTIGMPVVIQVAQCKTAVNSWLDSAASDDPVNNSVEHDIRLLLFVTHAYIEEAPDPFGGVEYLVNQQDIVSDEIDDLGDSESPACADPNGAFDQLTTDAETVSTDTAGGPETVSDAQSVLRDYSQLNGEMQSNAGVAIPDSDPHLKAGS
jgi:hypothetical protein